MGTFIEYKIRNITFTNSQKCLSVSLIFSRVLSVFDETQNNSSSMFPVSKILIPFGLIEPFLILHRFHILIKFFRRPCSHPCFRSYIATSAVLQLNKEKEGRRVRKSGVSKFLFYTNYYPIFLCIMYGDLLNDAKYLAFFPSRKNVIIYSNFTFCKKQLTNCQGMNVSNMKSSNSFW